MRAVKKVLVFLFFLIAVSFFLGKELSPFDLSFFTVHDNTQVARLQQFALSLRSGVIPPRLAPDFSFQLGYPVFNFYAPFSYWIGGILSLAISPAIALKSLFFFGVILSFITMFVFVSSRTTFEKGVLSGAIYASSLWMAVEVFIRGNVGEIWFIALFPLGFHMLLHQPKSRKALFFVGAVCILSALFTVHNVLSLVALPILLIAAAVTPNRKQGFLVIFLALCLSSYFLVPAIAESRLTYATEIASKTLPSDHFLCSWQLWRADKWEFGGSGKGCLNDGMSFQIGKPHILIGLIGVCLFLYEVFILKKRSKNMYSSFFILALGISMAFLTTYSSEPIWNLFKLVMNVFQFPWRLLPFVVFALSYFGSYAVNLIHNKTLKNILLLGGAFVFLFTSSKFFSRPWKYNLHEYETMFLSSRYIEQQAAYEIPEYLPRTGSYLAWRQVGTAPYTHHSNQSPFTRVYNATQQQTTLPLIYFPYWQIFVNGTFTTPHRFDSIGRPILQTNPGDIIHVSYVQTPVEVAADLIAITTIIVLSALCISQPLWNKINAMTK